ncbi:hypothetical protein [uncultured Tateyamaria sp.]|uniref:hypothetical protein n=1 Tax=uncultured Tateyamaria sp. TaxID=455651 RepID=UPI0026169A5D|nr:hypothetical protein [uncultured Tateyamaria sp.]
MTYTLIPGESCTASDEETMSTIRSVLTENTAPPQQVTPRAAPARAPAPDPARDTAPAAAAPEATRAFVDRTVDDAPRRRASDLPNLETAKQTANRRPGLLSRLGMSLARPVGALRGFQPTTRHLALASVALLCVVRPHWIVIGTVLMLAMVLGAFMVLGSDRIWHGVLAWLDRVEARDSARACELRGKLDSFACRWDGILDIFPDGMVDSLYMPDFQAMQQAEIDHQQVVSDRLNRMAQEG